VWRVWVVCGAAVWLTTIVASGAINFVAASQYGKSAIEALAFGGLAISADIWKATGPVFVAALWRAKRRSASLIAGLVWVCCFTFALSAALGLAAQNRSQLTAGSEGIGITYRSTEKELRELEDQRSRLGAQRSPGEVQAAIEASMARPAGAGTVGTLSTSCTKDHWRTRTACGDVARLRQELASANEAERLETQIRRLQHKASLLRGRGVLSDADPQGELISRLTFGFLDVSDVGLGLVLLLAVMVELISAFAPLVVQEYASIRRKSRLAVPRRAVSSDVAPARDTARLLPPTGGLFEFIADRVVPRARSAVSIENLFQDYSQWCRTLRLACESREVFLSRFETIAKSDLGGRVYRKGNEYYGFRLSSRPQATIGRRRSVRRKNSL
jgi:hypothetical protein